jgi:pyruvate-ferredoxin/flavodoxin oxidoreductase
LHGLQGGGVRGRPGLFVQPWGQTCVDRLNSAPGPLADPGDDCPVDLLLLLTDRSLVGGRLPVELDADARVLALTRLPEETLWARLPAGERKRLKKGGALYLLPPPDGEPGLQSDYLLGAICALLLETGLIDTTRRRLLALREDQLKRAVADADARLKHFEAGLGAPRRIDVTRLPRATARAGVSTVDEAPALVHHIGGRADAYDSLPRFWDRVGVLYSNGDTDELGPDPHLGLGAIPQLAAGFRDHLLLRERLPVLDPSLCTGCGRCWSACPEGAIGALALTPARLIDAGIRAAGADVLRPIVGKLADAAVKRCLDATGGPDTRPTNAGLLLREAFAQLEDRLPFPDERKQAIGKAVDACVDAIGAVPVVASEALFQGPERDRQGGGLLLALSLSPHSCKACGLCVASCEPGALRTERQGSQALAAARAARAAWHRLPDSEADVAQRAAQSAEPDALALALLGQGAARSTAGGDGVEPGSGARLALRLTVAMLEAHQARLQSAHADAVEQARGRILALIRDVLAGALPADDLD